MLSPVISSLSNLSSLTRGSTCLQRLHLFEWIHLLPQPLQLGLHIIFLRSCISMKRRGKKKKKKHRTDDHRWRFSLSPPCVCHVCVVTSGLPRCHGLPGAGWTAGAEVEQGEAEDEEDREGQTCHVWVQWILQDGTQWHTLYCCERNRKTLQAALYIYWPSMCLSGCAPCIGSSSVCVCPNIRRRWERYKGGVANNDFLVSGFLINIYLGQGALSSIPFHFTNKLEILWLLRYYRVFFTLSNAQCQSLDLWKVMLRLCAIPRKKVLDCQTVPPNYHLCTLSGINLHLEGLNVHFPV